MSSKLCRYALCPIFLTEEHKEQKQLIRIFSKVCLYVLLSNFFDSLLFSGGEAWRDVLP